MFVGRMGVCVDYAFSFVLVFLVVLACLFEEEGCSFYCFGVGGCEGEVFGDVMVKEMRGELRRRAESHWTDELG